MNILSISKKDAAGGASLAAYRLHRCFCSRPDVEARMLVGNKESDDPTVEQVFASKYRNFANKAAGQFFEELGLQGLYYPSTRRLHNHEYVTDWADVILLRNVHGGYMSYRALPGLSRNAPLVWRLPDVWSVTGGCYYPYDCTRYQNGCGSCPQLGGQVDFPWDSTGLLWRLKRRAYTRTNLDIITPSRWLANIVDNSQLMGEFDTHHIPTGADVDIFSPVDRDTARDILDIPVTASTVLFCASNLTDPRKGGRELVAALDTLDTSSDDPVRVLLVGQGGTKLGTTIDDISGIEPVHLGEVRNDRFLAVCYSAADVLALPTLADNLPNVLLESMACETPAVAFDTGGCSEPINDGVNSIVASYGDPDSLAAGLTRLLQNPSVRNRMGQSARETVVSSYSMSLQADRYVGLFRRLRE